MGSKIYIGSISPEGEHLLNAYLSKFMPDAEVEPLKPAGIKGKMKNRASRSEVALVIIDESLWRLCEGVVDDVLAMKKVHKYVNDDGLKQFLIQKFGVVDIFADSGAIVPENYIDAPDLPELASDSHSFVPSDNIVHTVDDEDMSMGYSSSDDTEDISAVRDSEVIAELKDKLARSEMLVRNLTQQLNDEKEDSDIQEFIFRIRELETKLAEKEKELQNASSEDYINLGKIAKAENIIKESDAIKGQLKEANEAKAALEYERTKLESQVELLDNQIEELRIENAELVELRGRIDALTSDLEERDKSISDLTDKVESKDNDIHSKEAEIEVLQSRITEMGQVSTELSQSRSEFADKEIELNQLKVDYDARVSEIKSLNTNITSLNEKINELENSLKQKSEEIESLRSSIDNLDSEKLQQNSVVSDLQAEIESLKSDIAAKEEELANQRDTIEILQSDSEKLSHKDAEINMMNANMIEQRTLVDNLNNQISLKSEECEGLQLKLQALSEESVAQVDKYEELSSQYSELSESLKVRDEENNNLVSEIDSLKASISEKEEQISSGVESKRQDAIKIAKLEAQIETLQESLIDASADEETINSLNSDLLEERRKSARLQSEVEVLRRNDDTTKSSELRLEISRLRKELEAEKANNSNVDTGELDSLRAELASSKERIVDLELSLSEQRETVSDLSNSIFSKVSNIAYLPKAALSIGLTPVPCVDDRFYCIASGSAESVSSLYDVIRRICVVNTGVRYLLLDLGADSYVDSAFGARKIESPVDWLKGEANFRQCISNTRFDNVKVISTGFSYLNDLFYLNLDWKYRLEELKGYADVVIFNIGCLNNFVTKLLFNTFSENYKTYVVTKSSPINLRATSLELSGLLINPNPNVVIECIDFDTRSSNNSIYQRLASKYNTHILHDNDVLKL